MVVKSTPNLRTIPGWPSQNPALLLPRRLIQLLHQLGRGVAHAADTPPSQHPIHLEHRPDPLPVPVIFQVSGVQAVFDDAGAQGGQAFAAGVAHRRVDDAERACGPQAAADGLGVAVVVGGDDAGIALAGFAQVGRFAFGFDGVEPHLQSHRRLGGGGHEAGGVVAGFGDGGVALAGAVEDAVAAVAEAAALRVGVGEGGHDAGAAGAEQALFGRDEADLADFVAQAVVGHGLQRIQRVEVFGAGDALEQADGGKAAGDDPVGRAPLQPRIGDAQAQPPRRASR